jgi:hypothetical protein
VQSISCRSSSRLALSIFSHDVRLENSDYSRGERIFCDYHLAAKSESFGKMFQNLPNTLPTTLNQPNHCPQSFFHEIESEDRKPTNIEAEHPISNSPSRIVDSLDKRGKEKAKAKF